MVRKGADVIGSGVLRSILLAKAESGTHEKIGEWRKMDPLAIAWQARFWLL